MPPSQHTLEMIRAIFRGTVNVIIATGVASLLWRCPVEKIADVLRLLFAWDKGWMIAFWIALAIICLEALIIWILWRTFDNRIKQIAAQKKHVESTHQNLRERPTSSIERPRVQ